MSYEIKAISIPSTDNIHTLQGKIFIPEGEVKGIFQIVHGMTEYIDRYDHLMAFLSKNGYVCFGFDNLGHGKTAKNESELGFIAHTDGWRYLVNDVLAFTKAVKQIYPTQPVILMGHSMGSFIVRLVAEHYCSEYQKFIFCGTSGPNPLMGIGRAFTAVKKAIHGEKYISKTVYNLAFGSYNKGFEGISDYDWLTKDRQVIEKYEKDKFCNFKFTISAMQDLMKLLSLCNHKEWFNNISRNTPILLLAGDKDPVGNYGKGVKTVYEKLKKHGANVEIRLYSNCRHEIHNDTCKEEMFNDILRFIK